MGDRSLLARLLYEVRHHMSLQMIDVYHRDTERLAHPLGESPSDQQGSQESGTSRVGDHVYILSRNPGLPDSLTDDGDHVLQVGSTGQLGHYATVLLVDLLARYDV